ncbi:MAG: hypothetical protein DRO11_09075 [Methanobacteriota archaeon]|nr:MAG: hypothetical protein DRO11_09075 [Euryarchaeota archaeon]
MAKRLSEYYGVQIYTDKGKYAGEVYDLILDVDSGEVVAISIDEDQFTGKSIGIPYKHVKAVGDILIIESVEPVKTKPSPSRTT